VVQHLVVAPGQGQPVREHLNDALVLDLAHAEEVGPGSSEHQLDDRGELVELAVSNRDGPTFELSLQLPGELRVTLGAGRIEEVLEVPPCDAYIGWHGPSLLSRP